MANTEGMTHKFLVLKTDDVDMYLTPTERNQLSVIFKTIEDARKYIGKKPFNNYLVINTDESYVDEVIEIMKHNGHWG